MKASLKIIFVVLVIIIAGIVLLQYKSQRKNKTGNPPKLTIHLNIMKIASPVFQNNESIPAKFTCDGENINPPLEIKDVPENAKSLALIMDDPDAPAAGGFVHWVVFSIDPAIKEIRENSAPQNAIEGTNSAGRVGFTSPCPPSGTHRYFFKLYALDATLALDSSATREDVKKAIEGHILDQATLVGLYQRQ